MFVDIAVDLCYVSPGVTVCMYVRVGNFLMLKSIYCNLSHGYYYIYQYLDINVTLYIIGIINCAVATLVLLRKTSDLLRYWNVSLALVLFL